jgi:hypothetical protein
MKPRYWIAAALAVVAVIGVVLLAADTRDSEARTVEAAGISAKVPKGWHQRLPNDPIQLAVHTDSWFVGENCDRKTDYTTVLLSITRVTTFNAAPSPSRPEHFDATQGTGLESGGADLPCGMTTQAIPFTDKGKEWVANVSFGRDAPERRHVQAYSILDSLRLPTDSS